jgi:hypothetical protein
MLGLGRRIGKGLALAATHTRIFYLISPTPKSPAHTPDQRDRHSKQR